MFGIGLDGVSNTAMKQAVKKITSVNSLIRDLYPKDMEQVFYWAAELWVHHGIYSSAISKAVRYFMSDIEVYTSEEEAISIEAKQSYERVLKNDMNIIETLGTIGDDLVAWGNSFTSIIPQINRTLVCPHCGSYYQYKAMVEEGHAIWDSGKLLFKGVCPAAHCKKAVNEYTVHDSELSVTEYPPNIVSWPPQFISIQHNPITNKNTYTLDVTGYSDVVDGIRKGQSTFLEDLPWEFVEAVKSNGKIKFSQNSIHHIKTNSPAYISQSMRGWGMPLFMREFETAMLLMLLDRYTENIITEYLIPFRLLSPPAARGGEAKSTSLGIMNTVNMGGFASDLKAMLDRHRVDPTGYNFFPFPIEYQLLGGEARNLVPDDIIQRYEQRLLSGIGVPAEFHMQGMNNDAAPIIGFRMFERSWSFLGTGLNDWLTWVCSQIGDMMHWEPVMSRLVPTSMYEDPAIQQIKLNMFGSKQVSGATAFKSIGLDFAAERDTILREELADNERMTKQQAEIEKQQANQIAVDIPSPAEKMLMQQDQEAAAQQGAASGGVPPAGPPPSIVPQSGEASATIDSLMAEAQQLAEQLLTMPASARKSELINLKHNNPALHAQTKAMLNDLEQQGKQMGVEQVRQGGMPQ